MENHIQAIVISWKMADNFHNIPLEALFSHFPGASAERALKFNLIHFRFSSFDDGASGNFCGSTKKWFFFSFFWWCTILSIFFLFISFFHAYLSFWFRSELEFFMLILTKTQFHHFQILFFWRIISFFSLVLGGFDKYGGKLKFRKILSSLSLKLQDDDRWLKELVSKHKIRRKKHSRLFFFKWM